MTTVPADLVARLADRYTLSELIGRGGMATVYRARDLRHPRDVAIKVLRPDLAVSIGTDRFLKEIEIAAQLTHPHILPLYDSGVAGEFLYYVMPLIDGESLRGLINRIGLMDLAGARAIARRVAEALDFAHRKGVIHRDIKPENILLPDGHAVVADFGIAKAVHSAAAPALTRTGIALGTPGYMSPEQAAAADDVDHRSDVFSLGVVCYEMLTGGLPGQWLSDDAVREGRFPRAPDAHRALLERLPEGLEAVLVRALAIRPGMRFPAAGEFADALDQPAGTRTPARAVTVQPPVIPAPAAPVRAAPAMDVPTEGGLGAPTLLEFEQTIDGELADDDLELVVDEMRAAFGFAGETRAAPGTLTWSAHPFEPAGDFDFEAQLGSRAHLYTAPKVQLRIVCRQGRTRIRLEQRLGGAAGGVFGGVLGGGAAATGGLILPIGIAAMNLPPVGPILLTAGAWGGLYWLSRRIFHSIARTRQRRLADVFTSVVDLCADLAR